MNPGEFLDRLLVGTRTHQPLALPLPEINLDAFKVCIFGRWRLGELLYINLATSFGTPSPPNLQHNSPLGLRICFTLPTS